MRNAGRAIALIIFAAAAFWVWRTFFPGPETVIKRRLEKLAYSASFSSGDGMVSRALSAQRMPDFFAPQVDVMIDIPGHARHSFASREDIGQAAMASRQGPPMSVKFPDITVALGAGGDTAVADVTLDARLAGDKDEIVQELQVTFCKTNDNWLITKVQTVRPVSMP